MPISNTPQEGAGFNIYQLGQIEAEALQSLGIPLDTPLDSLSPSQQEAIAIYIFANNPSLFGQYSSLFANAQANAGSQAVFDLAVASVNAQMSEIISQMLDAWSKSIEVQKEESKADSLRRDIVREQIKHDVKERDVLNQYIEWAEKQPDYGKANVVDTGTFVNYLSYLVKHQQHDTITATVNLMVGGYFDTAKPPVIEDSAFARSLVSAVTLQTLVVAPALQNLITPIDQASLSTQIGVNPVRDQAVLQAGAFPSHIINQVIPTINLFVMGLTADVLVGTYGKIKETGKPALDKEFADSVANKILAETSNPSDIKNRLIRQIPGMEKATAEQMNDAVTYAQLFSLTSGIALLVKAHENGKLQEQELKQMLVDGKGFEEGDMISKLVGRLNVLLGEIASPEKRAQFSEAMLRYLSSMPTPGLGVDMKALNAAAMEISNGQIAVNTRRD